MLIILLSLNSPSKATKASWQNRICIFTENSQHSKAYCKKEHHPELPVDQAFVQVGEIIDLLVHTYIIEVMHTNTATSMCNSRIKHIKLKPEISTVIKITIFHSLRHSIRRLSIKETLYGQWLQFKHVKRYSLYI